jgi:hypothetical protein
MVSSVRRYMLGLLCCLLTACALQNMEMVQRLNHPPPPRPASAAWQENRIQVGMSTAEVRALLPEPDSVDTVADGIWWGYFFSEEEVYFIRFMYGKVVLLVKTSREKLRKAFGLSPLPQSS